jgi:tetratricopeptide (TPR) repeat protein
MHLTNLDDDIIEDSISELIICSFIYPEVVGSEEGPITEYSMLSLTRGFIENKLDNNEQILKMLQTRLYELSYQIEQLEKSQKDYYQSLSSFGIKSEEDKIAFNYVKTAKNFVKSDNYEDAEKNFIKAVNISPNLSYVLNEYAKFEFNRGHTSKANELFTNAIKVDPDNFHTYFSYGITLKRQNLIKDAIDMLKKAIELNPNYLASHVELGRLYCFNGDYEKADEQFTKAKDKSKNPNYRHEFLRMQFQADNYLRWSEAFFIRNDSQSGLEKLHRALEIAERVNIFKANDKKALLLKKKINRELAHNLSKLGRFEDAMPYYEKCFEPICLEDGTPISNDPEMVTAYYNYANYGFWQKKLTVQEIKRAIKNGLHIARNPKMIGRFMELDKKISKRENAIMQDKKTFNGIILWFNTKRGFGLVQYGDQESLFFLSGFKSKLEPAEIEYLKGKMVTFKIIDSKDKDGKNKKLAIDIEFDDSSTECAKK